jgi:hypothetical protein
MDILKNVAYVPNIVLVGYGRTQCYQVKCFRCGKLFFGENIGFCESCMNHPVEKLLKNIPEENITDVPGVGIYVDWVVKSTASQKRSRYNFKKVLQRDCYICRYCAYDPRKSIDFIPLHVDHVIPWVYGGGNTLNNLVTSCHLCNVIANSRIFATFEDKRKYILKRRLEKHLFVPEFLIKLYEL